MRQQRTLDDMLHLLIEIELAQVAWKVAQLLERGGLCKEAQQVALLPRGPKHAQVDSRE